MTKRTAIGYAIMALRYIGASLDDIKLFLIVFDHLIDSRPVEKADALASENQYMV